MTASEGAPSVAFFTAIDSLPILPVLGIMLVVALIASALGFRSTRRDSPDPESSEREIRDALARRTLRAGRPLRDDPPADADDLSDGASAEQG